MIYNNYNGDNFDFSAWGGETTPTPVEEPVEEYTPATRTGKINCLLDEYLERKSNLNKIKGIKGAEELEKIYQKILDNLANKLNEL